MVAGENAEGDTVFPCNSERRDHGRSAWGSSSLMSGDAWGSCEFPAGEIGDLDSFPRTSSATFEDPSVPDGLCAVSALRRRNMKNTARPSNIKIAEAPTPTPMPTIAPVLRPEESSVEEVAVVPGRRADGVDVEVLGPAVEVAESREDVIVGIEVVLCWWYTEDGSDTSHSRVLSLLSRSEGRMATSGMTLAVKDGKTGGMSVLGQTTFFSHGAGVFVM